MHSKIENTKYAAYLESLQERVLSGVPLNSRSLSRRITRLGDYLGVPEPHEQRCERAQLNIALAMPYHPLKETGGLEIYTLLLAKELARMGHGVEIVTRGQYAEDTNWLGRHETPDGIAISGHGDGIMAIAPELLRRSSEFDVIQWMEIFPPTPEVSTKYNGNAQCQYLASVLLRSFGKATVLNVATNGNVLKRGVDNPQWAREPNDQSLTHLLGLAMNGYSFVTRQIRGELDEAGIPNTENNAQFIPAGVDTAQFKPVSAAEKITLKEKWGLPKNKRIVTFAGRFVDRKQPDMLVRSWLALPPEIREKGHLVMVGGAMSEGQPDSVRPLVQELIGEARDISEIGMIPHEQLADFLNACDVFALPSYREGWPLMIMDAMACQLPIIASNIDGVTDAVDTKCGWLIDPHNQDSLTRALIQALSVSDNKLVSMGQQGRNKIADNWSWDKIAQQFLELYRNL